MKAQIDFDQFVNMLIEAKKAIEKANALDDTVQQLGQRKTAIENQITALTKEAETLAGSVGSLKADLEKEYAARRASAEASFATHRSKLEAETQQLMDRAENVRVSTVAEIARLSADETAAKQAADTARAELAVLTEALERSRKEATTLARLANVGRA